MKNTIGGYFELELYRGGHYHEKAIKLNTASNCFEYVLRAKRYSKVYIPYYTCDVMLKPLKKLDVKYVFYHINESLELLDTPKLNKGEGILYTNYFGLKQSYVKHFLANLYGNQLIVDNAQAFYAEPILGIDTFYSARKFFGVPDGAFLYTDKKLEYEPEQDISYERMMHLLKRLELGAEAGYNDFKKNDKLLSNDGIKLMSKLTDKLLLGVDYEFAKKQRRENYLFLESALKTSNLIHLKMDDNAVPLVYPYLANNLELKNKLISNKIFVATYWPNVFDWCKKNDWEYTMAERMAFVPIDQRYKEMDMKKIIEIIQRYNTTI